MELIDRIEAGGVDPQALLIYGADEAQLGRYSDRLIRHWLGVDGDRDLSRHVDYQLIEPWGSGRQIKTEAVHPVKNAEEEGKFLGIPMIVFYRTRPMMARNKVVWIRQSERMNGSASNAFLKTLEELPSHARVVLTTSAFAQVLPTIRSRCLCVAAGFEGWGGAEPESEMERVWAKNGGDLARLRVVSEECEGLWGILEAIDGTPRGAAVRLGEQLMSLAKGVSDGLGIPARESQVFLVELIARWIFAKRPEWADIGAECHLIAREISGYSQAQLGFDTLFGMMLAKTLEPVGTGER